MSNFDIKEERDDSRSSDNSYSQQVSPLKSNIKPANFVLSDVESASTHKINQFDKQKYFQYKFQREEGSRIAQLSDKNEDLGPINELEQNLLLSIYSDDRARLDSVEGKV